MLAAIKFLGESGQGVVSEMLRPFRLKLERILAGKYTGAGELIRRVRILSMNARPQGDWFHVVAEGVARRRQIHMHYHDRARDQHTERTVSPQRLVHYRDAWYLDAWCHTRDGLRTFSVDRITGAQLCEDRARDIGEAQLDDELASSYGIFSGPPTAVAELIFSETAARWVRSERWHRDQEGEELPDGRYRLRVPYNSPTELMRDVLRFGANVEVVAPHALIQFVQQELRRALACYGAIGEEAHG
jgi:predicted DNA-binding transcriptional regulator YafY